MKKFLMLFVFLLCWTPVFSGADEITIYDNVSDTGASSDWYDDGEDQEVEPGAATGQEWDLEGVFYDGTYISLVGGWDFLGTEDGYSSGDIFVSTTGDAIYGSDITSVETVDGDDSFIYNTFGYEYVFDVDWDSGTWTLYEIDEDTVLLNADAFETGNPVSYVSGAVQAIAVDVAFSYESDLTDAETGFEGGTHYEVSGFDISLIVGEDGSFLVHFTMECGNDTLVGEQVPEPATMLLFGMGLLGLGAIGRKLPLKS